MAKLRQMYLISKGKRGNISEVMLKAEISIIIVKYAMLGNFSFRTIYSYIVLITT